MSEEVLDANRPINCDRLYCRDDDGMVHDAIVQNYNARCYFGLRRFGKTSFLKKIERRCTDSERYPSHRAHFVSVQSLDAEEHKLAEVEKDAKSKSNTILLLLDDVQYIENWTGDKERERFASRFFERLRKLKGLGVRFVVAEPTNIGEYLAGQKVGSKANNYGARFREILGDAVGRVHHRFCLPKLTVSETQKILCGDITSKPPKSIDQGFIDRAYSEFGGNPWLLAHARMAIDDDEVVLSDFSMLQRHVFDRTTEFNQRNLLSSIYGSLSTSERFVLRVLQSVNSGIGHGAAEVQSKSKSYWRSNDDVGDMAHHLSALGLIDSTDTYPRKIPAESLQHVVLDSIENDEGSPFDKAYNDVKDLWLRYIAVEHPLRRQPRGELVVHQLSDILFGLDREQDESAFSRYRDFLKQLKKEESPDRPHFIVICGNLISAQSGRKYAKTLDEAIQELTFLTRYMRPIGERPDDESASSKQIIVLPGVFDLRWTKGTESHDECRKSWDEAITDAGLSSAFGRALDFAKTPMGRIVFLPIDSLNIDGVMERLGPEAVDDIMDIRRGIQDDCSERFAPYLKDKDEDDPELKWRRAKFIDQTMRYVADNLPAEDDGRNAVDSPTFKWYLGIENSDETIKRVDRYSDVGFLSDADRAMIEASARDGDGSLKIAIIHHHPFQQNPSPVAEFFESVQLRRALARADIRLLLHGHSALQSLRTEIMSSRSERERANSANGRKISMVTSGVFSREASSFVDTNQCKFAGDWMNARCISERPSFNCIRMKPREENAPDGIEMRLDVYEMVDEHGADDRPFLKLAHFSPLVLSDDT